MRSSSMYPVESWRRNVFEGPVSNGCVVLCCVRIGGEVKQCSAVNAIYCAGNTRHEVEMRLRASAFRRTSNTVSVKEGVGTCGSSVKHEGPCRVAIMRWR
jgi:hypothetical protein